MSAEDILKIVIMPVVLLILSILFNKKLNKQKKDINGDIEKRDEANELKAKDREERRQKLVLDKLEDLEVNVTDMKIALTVHIEDTDFRTEFKDNIRNKSRQIIINLGDFLAPEHKNILSNWSDTIEKFGLDFFYSSKRKERKKNIDTWLTQEMDINIRNFYNFVDFMYEEIRVYNKKKVLFSNFLDTIKLHNRTELLKMRLIQNGLSMEDIIDLFSAYIEDFYADFVKAIKIWYTLEIFEREREVA